MSNATEPGYVQTHIENGLGEIIFYHPSGNSLPGKLLGELAQCITHLGNDQSVKVIILKSEGDKVFCAGASFDELIAIRNADDGKIFFSGFAAVINAMRKAPKLVLVRVQGKTVGGGVGLAASADYTLAHESASVKLSELAVGIGPFVVGPPIERRMGKSAFTQLAIHANAWQSAQWAREKGLYHEIFSTHDELDKALSTLAVTLSNSNPEAMLELKKIGWEGTEHWDSLLTARAAISGKLVLSDFTRKAISKFKQNK